MLVLNTDQIRLVEKNCFEKYYNEAQLMCFAGNKCHEAIVNEYGNSLKGASVAVLCGDGKNAGDGFIVAKLLYNYGANARIVICNNEPTISEPKMYFDEARSSGVKVENFSDKILNDDFIVDSMFGIGFHGEARAPYNNIFKLVNQSNATVISIDTPSGTNSATGEMCENAIKADFTIAISTLKFAHILPPSNALCGKTVAVDIGIPKDCYESTNNYVKTIDFIDVKSCFKPIDKNANKGTNGRQLNICGSYAMPGAAAICAKASLKSGVGLLKCVVLDKIYKILASQLNSPIFMPIGDEKDYFDITCADTVANKTNWADSIVLGCGIGCNENTKDFVEQILKNSKKPIILDADGINCINQGIDILKDVKVPVVLTPHPGEMARLISKTIPYVQQNRISVAKQFAMQNKVIVVLKGANTLVTDGKEVFVNLNGNPGMAKAGCGDMLTGMIGSFVAQGIEPFDAAKCAVFIHGKCGDLTASQVSKRGMIVLDMVDRLGALMSDFE